MKKLKTWLFVALSSILFFATTSHAALNRADLGSLSAGVYKIDLGDDYQVTVQINKKLAVTLLATDIELEPALASHTPSLKSLAGGPDGLPFLQVYVILGSDEDTTTYIIRLFPKQDAEDRASLELVDVVKTVNDGPNSYTDVTVLKDAKIQKLK
ncbi:MAG: hypothetical protein OM95_02460 [Bdellovibrio sp. ArHS]|uniref:hypothetical protein n=1 Tax=Bdellovibrio sp. ArHS TaxID=1569284 RepID=UPI000583BC7C|nr:hypothetical protein [Bdellovibrio sp. ArHS]KHD89609.1 MAG: hypothetical protein OM95_02460 [Bdellovibrio sp. ArHS]